MERNFSILDSENALIGVEVLGTAAFQHGAPHKLFENKAVSVRRTVSYIVRSKRAGSQSLLTDVQQPVWSLNPSLPLANVRTLQEIYDKSLARTSFTLVMLCARNNGGYRRTAGFSLPYGRCRWRDFSTIWSKTAELCFTTATRRRSSGPSSQLAGSSSGSLTRSAHLRSPKTHRFPRRGRFTAPNLTTHVGQLEVLLRC
jgi:hypothetical protein